MTFTLNVLWHKCPFWWPSHRGIMTFDKVWKNRRTSAVPQARQQIVTFLIFFIFWWWKRRKPAQNRHRRGSKNCTRTVDASGAPHDRWRRVPAGRTSKQYCDIFFSQIYCFFKAFPPFYGTCKRWNTLFWCLHKVGLAARGFKRW